MSRVRVSFRADMTALPRSLTRDSGDPINSADPSGYLFGVDLPDFNAASLSRGLGLIGFGLGAVSLLATAPVLIAGAGALAFAFGGSAIATDLGCTAGGTCD